jgi:exopolyphosphatase/guanosine-5'-triphosphate,3'-diphosphate pyrophosphatase
VREAENRDVFIDTVRRKTGFNVEVLNVGDVVYFIDAFLSYKLEKKYPINERNLLIAEIGAGSLDISVLEKGLALQNIGIPIGTLRLKQFKNSIDGSSKETYEALDEYIDNEIVNLKRIIGDFKLNDIMLIDESYSAVLERVLPKKSRDKNFFSFQYREAKQLLAKFTQRNLDDLTEKYGIPTDISETIDGYAMIITKLFKLIKKRTLYILQTSLSEALLANMVFEFDVAKKYNKSHQLLSVVKFIGNKYGTDIKNSRQVAFISEELFKQLSAFLGLGPDDLLYLQLAAYLRNVGLNINNRGYHKHSEYIVNALSLFRLTPMEIRCIACVTRYHRKAHPQRTHFLYGSLSLNEQLLVQKLAAILRIANALDVSHKQKVKKCEVQFTKNGDVEIVVQVQGSFTLERVTLSQHKQLFEEVSGSKVNLRIQQLQ